MPRASDVDADLGADVKAFASTLGFAPSAASGDVARGFDDRDFRAEHLRRKARAAAGTTKTTRAGEDADGKSRVRGNRAKRASTEARDGGEATETATEARRGRGKVSEGDEGDAADARRASGKKRPWNPGAGPMPTKEESGGDAKGGRARNGAGASGGAWYETVKALNAELGAAKTKTKSASRGELEAKEKMAKSALEERVGSYAKRLQRKSDANAKWLEMVRTSGTASDKVAANVLSVTEDPVANLKALENLLGLVERARASGGKRGAVQSITALETLFRESLLPDRKLKYFSEQPLAASADAPHERKRLMYWHVEDSIKRMYLRFIGALDELSRDPLPILKEKALKSAYALLKAKPEGERQLLNILVNKLGDPSRKIASNASYLCLELIKAHPAMKRIVAREVEAFTFRRGVGLKAQYYAAVMLNQISLSHRGDGPALAEQLIEAYFGLFQYLYKLSLKKDVDDAGEDAKPEPKKKEKHRHRDGGRGRGSRGGRGGRGGRGRGRGGKDAKKQEQPAQIGAGVDARVVSALLTGINRAFPYVASEKVDALIDRISPALFTIAHSPNLGGALQAMMLLFQLLSARSSVSDRYYRALYALLLHPGLARSTNTSQVLSLIYKSLREDVVPKRSAAMVKRLLQVASQAPATFACGALMSVSEFLAKQPSHWNAIRQPRDAEDDGVEHFSDVRGDDDDDDDARTGLFEGDEMEHDKLKPASDSEKSSDGDEGAGLGAERRVASASERYDMEKREPMYARAETSCWWELNVLATNAHPSVAAMSRTLLQGKPIEYDGDPLADMTLTVFLDKWLQKKPKKRSKGGSDVMRAANADVSDAYMPGTEEFASLMESEVDPSDVFFHRYFANKAEKAAAKKKKVDKKTTEDASDAESESDPDGELPKKKYDDSESEGEESEDELAVEEINIDEASDSDDEALAVSLKKVKKDDFKDVDFDEEADEEFLRSERQEEGIEDDRFNLDALAKAYGKPPGYLLAESAEREREEEAKAIKAIKRAVQEGPKDEDDTAVGDFTSGGVFASADDYADMINDDDANAVDPSKLDDEDADADEDEGDIDVNDDDESDDDDDENDDDDDDESDEEPSPPPKTRSSSSKKTKTPKSSSKSPRVPFEDAPQLRVTRSSKRARR